MNTFLCKSMVDPIAVPRVLVFSLQAAAGRYRGVLRAMDAVSTSPGSMLELPALTLSRSRSNHPAVPSSLKQSPAACPFPLFVNVLSHQLTDNCDRHLPLLWLVPFLCGVESHS